MSRGVTVLFKKDKDGVLQSQKVHPIDAPAWIEDGWKPENVESKPVIVEGIPHELSSINGVNKGVLALLIANGIDTVEILKATSLDSLVAINGIGESTALKIVEALESK